jgi:mannosyltransferase
MAMAALRDRERRLGRWLVLALAVGLYAWRLDVKNLWLDECASWDMATQSVRALIASTAADIHPPLYYLLLKGWMWWLGDSPIALRSLSALSSLASVWLMFRLAEGVLPRGATVAVVLWYAASPNVVSFSQEARMYALATACVLGMCLAYRRWLESGFHARHALVAYAGCATAALYLHYFTALAVAAIWAHATLWAVGVFSRSDDTPRLRWKDWLRAHAVMAALYAPWVATAVTQLARGQPWRQPIAIGQIPEHAADLVGGLIFGTYFVPPLESTRCVIVVAILLSGLIGCAVGAIRSPGRERHAFFLLVTFLPALSALALLPLSGKLNLSRYLLYTTPLLFLTTACGLGAWRLPGPCVTGLLILGCVVPLPSLRAYYKAGVRDYDAKPIVTYLAQAARHGPSEAQDAILVAPGYVTDVLRYLSRGNLVYQRVDSEAELSQAIAAAAQEHRLVWVVVDYRWRTFDDIAHDPRLESEDVPSSAPTNIRLFRAGG